MYMAIQSIEKTIHSHNLYEFFEPNKYIYTKHYYLINMPSLRVVIELKDELLQVKSIHFRLYKKIQPYD